MHWGFKKTQNFANLKMMLVLFFNKVTLFEKNKKEEEALSHTAAAADAEAALHIYSQLNEHRAVCDTVYLHSHRD